MPERDGETPEPLPPSASADAIEAFNRDCRCITLDDVALRRALEADLMSAGLPLPLLESQPHLFAALPVFLSRTHVARLQEIIRSVETVTRLDLYRERVCEWAPEIARFEPGALGAFFGYDFHLSVGGAPHVGAGSEAKVDPIGPRLIEINTNAGGALLNAYLARAQKACCEEVSALLVAPTDPAAIEKAIVAMFQNEWNLQRPDEELRRIAIVDSAPREQAMYPEFVLFQRLFERHGIAAVVADPAELRLRQRALWAGAAKIDLVYNRVCDFYLESPDNAVLLEAYLSRAAVLTPHPRAYALYADKRNLTLLSNAQALRDLGAESLDIDTLSAGIPPTLRVSAENADELWSTRKQLFFKPVTGYGSRGAYRGAKLTKRVWQSILASDYVAQQLVQPSERGIVLNDEAVALKVDLRAYVYAGEVQFLAARMYQGQTTNLRTPGGGFAPVFTEASHYTV